jgi:hypothetical protein
MTDEFNTQEDDELMGEPSLDSLAPEVEEDEAEDLDEEIPLSSLKSSDLGDDTDEEVEEDEDEEEDDMEDLGSEDWEI